MAHDPERHDDLAMRHVLGGLDEAEASSFRQHLTGCAECRRRVAELRGIAADLQQVDRRERASLAALRTEARPTVEPVRGDEEDEPSRLRVSERMLAVALAVGIVLVLAMAFWNFHLRSREAALFTTIAQQEAVLDLLVTGRPVAVELPTDARGTVVVEDGRYGVDVTGIAPEPGDAVVLWLYDASGELLPLATRRAAADRLPGDGQFYAAGDVGEAVRLVLSLESARDDRLGPSERVLVEAQLVETSQPGQEPDPETGQGASGDAP